MESTILGVLSMLAIALWFLLGGNRNGGGCGGCLLVLIVILGIGALVVVALPFIGIAFGILVVIAMLRLIFS